MLSCLHFQREHNACTLEYGCMVASWKLPVLHFALC